MQRKPTARAWHQQLELTIEPHAALSKAQQGVVRFEKFSEANSMVRSVRAALSTYVLRKLRVAIDPAKHTPPDYRLMLRDPQGHGQRIYDVPPLEP